VGTTHAWQCSSAVTGHSLGQLICQLFFLSCSDQRTMAKQSARLPPTLEYPNYAWDAQPKRNTSQGLSTANRGRKTRWLHHAAAHVRIRSVAHALARSDATRPKRDRCITDDARHRFLPVELVDRPAVLDPIQPHVRVGFAVGNDACCVHSTPDALAPSSSGGSSKGPTAEADTNSSAPWGRPAPLRHRRAHRIASHRIASHRIASHRTKRRANKRSNRKAEGLD
jgi:hypothetical protein